MGCYEGVKVVSRRDGILQLAGYRNAIISEHNVEIFIASSEAQTASVFKFCMETKTSELIFSFQSIFLSYLSVSQNNIACVGEKLDDIRLYARKSGTESSVRLRGCNRLSHLVFDMDGHLLVTSKQKRLHKYRLSDDGKATLIWSCGELEGDGGIAIADNGQIYVCGAHNRTIHIVGNGGK